MPEEQDVSDDDVIRFARDKIDVLISKIESADTRIDLLSDQCLESDKTIAELVKRTVATELQVVSLASRVAALESNQPANPPPVQPVKRPTEDRGGLSAGLLAILFCAAVAVLGFFWWTGDDE